MEAQLREQGLLDHLAATPTDYAEMGNTVAADEVLATANEWYAMYNANINATAPHLISGFTFQAGKADGGGATITAGSGTSIKITDAGHGLLDGDYVTVQSTSHVGIGTVTYLGVNDFEVDIAFVGNEACTWQMGSYLQCNKTGMYRGICTASISQSLGTRKVSKVTPVMNATANAKAASQLFISNNLDIENCGGNGIMSLTAGDRVWFAVQSASAQTLTFEHRNVSIH